MNNDPASKASNKSSDKSAGGVFIAFGGLAGGMIGIFMGQPSAGLLSGLGVGGLIALMLWLKER